MQFSEIQVSESQFSESDNPESQAFSSVSDASSASSAAPEPAPQASAETEASLPLAARIINSKSLFGESRIIHIEHRGMIYRMSITNQNRLILQK